jgi:hypothetical protein
VAGLLSCARHDVDEPKTIVKKAAAVAALRMPVNDLVVDFMIPKLMPLNGHKDKYYGVQRIRFGNNDGELCGQVDCIRELAGIGFRAALGSCNYAHITIKL